jgi:aspartyl-tRNA(Asn)/glutamyl-tRNA(Gln) amidotransferase subunit A
MNPQNLTISSTQKGLSNKEFSVSELVNTCLSNIKKLEPKINALITVCMKEAMVVAREQDAELRHKDTKTLFENKPLLGIPFVLKDIYSTKGIRTTAGSKVLKDYLPVYEATVVRKLKEAGAIVIGKSNLDAWAHGSSGENSDFGPARNPWNTEYVPGGSSSGSAVSLASGECLAATGTDTGGSIRLPASFCNLVGIKPTYGRVSRYGIIAMCSSMDSIGHFTRTVEDSAKILKISAGHDPLDATTPDIPVPDYVKNIGKKINGLRIGIPKEYFRAGIDKQIEAKIKDALKKLMALGAEIVSLSLPHTQYSLAVYYIIQPAEVSSNLARFDGIRFGNPRSAFSAEAKRRIMLGTYTLSAGYYDAYYLKAMKVRSLVKQDFDGAFKKVDLIAAPASPTLPWKIGEKVNDPLKMYMSDILTIPANLAGLPALSIPVGFAQNLPVGMQIIGPQFREDLIFRVGYAYQQITDWHEKKPSNHYFK